MNNKKVFVVLALIGISYPAFLSAKDLAPVKVQDSLVIVTSRTFIGKRAGNGFVIGDGTLVVTAHHLIFEGSEQGQHEMAGLVTIFSPYLGEGCDAEIIVADDQLDIAILKVGWPGHPALKLADDKSITSAEDMEIIGVPAIIRGMNPEGNFSLSESFDVECERLKVDFVAIQQHIPKFISLSGIGKLGDGWSGSPMVLSKTSKVAGCFVRLYRTAGQRTKTSQGPAISQVRNLLDKADELKSLNSPKLVVPKPKDGISVFVLFLEAYRHFSGHKYKLAFEETQTLIRMRPESSFAQTLAASAAEKQGKYNQAGQYYQKALKLNPEGTALRILYAQYLSEREPNKALEILDNMWKSEKIKPTVALLMFNILSERGNFQRCCDLLNKAIKVNPNNAYLRINLGACQLKLDKTDEAITSITKAVELLPERGPFRGQLAHVLEKAGKFEESEIHFRKLLEIEPDNPVVHMWLAKFLVKHRPFAKEEALKEAQIALGLPVKDGLSRETIEKFINDLRSNTVCEPKK